MVVETSCVNAFTVALARFKLIQNSVIHIHVLIMVLGPTGHLAVPHVALEPCLVCDIATVVVLVTVSASMVTCQQTKLPNVIWAPAAISIGLDGLAVVEIPEIKMFAYDSVEVAPDPLPRKSPNHVTALVSSVTHAWSLSKIRSNLDSLMVATIPPTSSTQMNL